MTESVNLYLVFDLFLFVVLWFFGSRSGVWLSMQRPRVPVLQTLSQGPEKLDAMRHLKCFYPFHLA